MLTREEVMKMEPSPEMDALIEHEVMGTRRPSKGWSINPKHYSTDISAAFEVVEKHHEVTVKRFETLKSHRYWCKVEYDYDKEPILVQADSAPEAICKAALLAHIEKEG